jgi:hypothetical protein
VVRNTSDVCTLAGNGTAVTTALGAGSPNYACLHGRMESATMWLGIAGFCISAIMLQRRVKVRSKPLKPVLHGLGCDSSRASASPPSCCSAA